MSRRFITLLVLLMIPYLLYSVAPEEKAGTTPVQSEYSKVRVSVDTRTIADTNSMKFTSAAILGDVDYTTFDSTVSEQTKFKLGPGYTSSEGFIGKSSDIFLSYKLYTSAGLQIILQVDQALFCKSAKSGKQYINWMVSSEGKSIGTVDKSAEHDYTSGNTMVIYTHPDGLIGTVGSIPITITTQSVAGYPNNKLYKATLKAMLKTTS